MLRILTSTAILFCALCGSASADFVFDAFSPGGGPTVSGATVSLSGFTEREVSAGGGYTVRAGGIGGPARITYSFVNTVAETYALSSNDPTGMTPNYNIDRLYVPFDFGADVADWSFQLLDLQADTQLIFQVSSLSEEQPFFLSTAQATALGNANQVTFEFDFAGSGAFGTGTFGGSNGELFANPEPTSALMFGAVVGVVGFVRRRRKIETIIA